MRPAAGGSPDGTRGGWALSRWLLGLAGGLPLPGLALSMPLALGGAAGLAILKPLAAPPRWLTFFAWASAGSAVDVLFSAWYQGVSLSRPTIAGFAVTAVLLFGLSRATSGTASAGQLLAGMGIGTTIYTVAGGGDARAHDGIVDLWKFGIAFPVTVLVVYVALKAGIKLLGATVLLTFLGMLSMFLGFRSHGLICMLTAIFVIIRGKRQEVNWRLLAGLGGVLILAIGLPRALDAGFFGQAVQANTLAESSSGAPALLAGRVEPPLSLTAIATRPILGFGNANSIPFSVISRAMLLANQLGFRNPSTYMPIWIRPGGEISLHSVLLGAWAEGGILAAVFPILLLFLFLKAALLARGPFGPLVTVACLQCAWDLIFSPWGENMAVRLSVTAIIALWNRAEGMDLSAHPTIAAGRWRATS